MAKSRSYALINSEYGERLAIPLNLLEKVLDEGYLVQIDYDDRIERVKTAKKFTVISGDDIDCQRAQQELEGRPT